MSHEGVPAGRGVGGRRVRGHRAGVRRARWKGLAAGRRLLAVVTLQLVLVCASGVRAQEATSLYRQGAFARSYRAAVVLDTAPSQTLAGQAALAYAMFEAPTDAVRLTWFGRATDAAQHAVALAPDDVGALLVLAQAKGDAALLKGPLQNLGVAGETRDLLRRVLEIEPDNPNALVGMGLWNLELVQRGVGWMFGARRKGALDMVKRGVALAPEDIELRIQYGRALRLVGDEAGARAQLRAAAQLPARSAVDRFWRKRASEDLAGKSVAF